MVHKLWEPFIIRMERVSDRIVFADIRISKCTYRFIAVYFLHAGYSLEDFEICFDDLRSKVLMGQRLGMKCMVGGDFNIELNRGWRGEK